MDRIVGEVDYPRKGETVGSVIEIQGWALSDNYTPDDLFLEIFVDDDFIVRSNRNEIRSDVANAYPHVKNSDKLGFHVEAKLDKFESGTHVLKVIAKTLGYSEIICDRKFSFIKKLLPPHRLREYVGREILIQ